MSLCLSLFIGPSLLHIMYSQSVMGKSQDQKGNSNVYKKTSASIYNFSELGTHIVYSAKFLFCSYFQYYSNTCTAQASNTALQPAALQPTGHHTELTFSRLRLAATILAWSQIRKSECFLSQAGRPARQLKTHSVSRVTV